MTVRPEFEFHMLNDAGKVKAIKVAELFSDLLTALDAMAPAGREMAIVKTHLQDASTWAKRAIAQLKENQ